MFEGEEETAGRDHLRKEQGCHVLK
jgi:hypothetical protein